MEGGSEGELSMLQKDSGSALLQSSDDASSAGAALAKEAAALFQSESYQECASILHQLLAKKENDPKVIHNVALAEFYRYGCTDPYKLLDVLDQVKRRCEELARAADEQLEGIGNNSSPNGSTTKPSPPDSVNYIEDYDASLPCLNTAIVYYHLKQYASALNVLEPLFANIEPVDESCALQICLLMLDITLASRRADKAAAVLHYVEKSYGLGQSSENSGNSQVPGTPQGNLQLGIGFINTTPTPAPLVNSPVGDNPLTPSAGEETLEEDALSIGLEIDGSHSVRNMPKRVPAPEKTPPAPGTDLKLLMHLYKVRFLHLTRSFKAAKREVKSALNLLKDNIPALLLKAQLEYSRGNYRKSMKLLTACSSRGEDSVMPIILSNLGCVYHFLKKDESSTLFFVRALKSYSVLSRERPLKLSTYSRDKSLEIYYNTGLVQLFSGNPLLAAASLQESAPMFFDKPSFWLRLGECCISALEKGLIPDVSPKREQLSAVIVGQDRFRRLILPSGSLNSSPTGASLESDEFSFLEDGSKPIKLSMRFGRKCFQNALYLLERSEAVKSDESGGGGGGSLEVEAEEGGGALGDSDNVGFSNSKKDPGGFSPAVEEFEHREKVEKGILKLCLLIDLAFVELCLGDPASAVRHSEEILQHPQVPKGYRFLAHAYAAEGHCISGRVKEAQEHLRECMMDWTSGGGEGGGAEERIQRENGGGGEGGSDDGEEVSLVEQVNFQRFTGAQARASLYVNFAAIHAVEGELLESRQCALQALAIAPGNQIALLALVFVEICQGRSKEAVAMLKRCRHFSVSRLKPVV